MFIGVETCEKLRHFKIKEGFIGIIERLEYAEKSRYRQSKIKPFG
jgi:hypothetical protein